MIVDADRGRAIALAQAGNFGDGDIAIAHGAESPLEIGAETIGSAQVTRHIGADLNRHSRWRRQMKVREKVGHPVDVGKRKIGTARESVQLLGRQIPVLPLNLPQVVEDQTVIISAESSDY